MIRERPRVRQDCAVDTADLPPARTLWLYLETLNAVAYFTDECRSAPAAMGLKGFWMGYFGCRAAPLGAVPPAVVEATFYNFHPDRVRRAIPDAWSLCPPADIVRSRSAAAASAIRRLLGPVADELATEITPTLRDDPVEALWQAATTVREHRGDGHVALLVGAGLDGCEVHVVQSGGKSIDPGVFQASRGWSADDWQAAVERLASRGLVDAGGTLTTHGCEVVDELERRTDELAGRPLEAVGADRVEHLIRTLGPASVRIAASGEINYPNPMGLPAV
jgi:hypothetical protein